MNLLPTIPVYAKTAALENSIILFYRNILNILIKHQKRLKKGIYMKSKIWGFWGFILLFNKN